VSNLQSTHFSVEKKLGFFFFLVCIFFFFFLYTEYLKKVKVRCIKQKSERPGTSLCRCSDPTDSGSEVGAADSHSLSVSGILHWRGRGRGRSSGGGLGGVGGLRGIHYLSSSPPIPLFESPKTLLFGT